MRFPHFPWGGSGWVSCYPRGLLHFNNKHANNNNNSNGNSTRNSNCNNNSNSKRQGYPRDLSPQSENLRGYTRDLLPRLKIVTVPTHAIHLTDLPESRVPSHSVHCSRWCHRQGGGTTLLYNFAVTPPLARHHLDCDTTLTVTLP